MCRAPGIYERHLVPSPKQVNRGPGTENPRADDGDAFARTLCRHSLAPGQNGCAARPTKERAARYVKAHAVSRVPAQAAAEAVEPAGPGTLR
jgi:hypothetical protein